MPATHFENVPFSQFNLGGDVMIKLDARAIGFIFGQKRDAHRRLLFVSIIQEENLFLAQTPGQEGIPQPPDGLANRPDRKKVINNWHVSVFLFS